MSPQMGVVTPDDVAAAVAAEAAIRAAADTAEAAARAAADAAHAGNFGLHTKIVRKTADQSVTNSVTLVNDTHLLLAIAASEVWIIEFFLINVSATSATPKMSLAFSVPAGAVYKARANYLNTTPASVATSVIETDSISFYADTIIRPAFHCVGVLINSTTAGDFQIKWCQNVATDEATTMKANSYIRATRLL